MSYDDLNSLAIYNSEVARGIVHTAEWKEKMAELQRAYNEEYKERYEHSETI